MKLILLLDFSLSRFQIRSLFGEKKGGDNLLLYFVLNSFLYIRTFIIDNVHCTCTRIIKMMIKHNLHTA